MIGAIPSELHLATTESERPFLVDLGDDAAVEPDAGGRQGGR